MAEDFFEQETRETRAALRNCLKESWESVERNTDIRPLIKQRPYVSILAAAAGGLVAGYLVTPPRRSPEEQRKRHEQKQQNKARKKPSSHPMAGTLLGALNPALRTFAATAAGAMFHGAQNNPAEHEQAHNHPDIPHHRIQI